MSNVFSLFILFMLFIEFLLSNGCIYTDGQRVKLKGLKMDKFNGKYGIINNKDNDKQERCGVLIDGEKEAKAIKLENLDKVPTILIHGEYHNLRDNKKFYHFVTNHLQDRIGVEYGSNKINELKKYGIFTKNVFGFDDEHIKHEIQSTKCRLPESVVELNWKESIVGSMVFSDDDIFDKFEEKIKMNLHEWRDLKKKISSSQYFTIYIGKSERDINAEHYKSEYQGIQKFKELCQDLELKKKDGSMAEHLKDERWAQFIDIWLELIQDYVIKKMKEDPFVDEKYQFIYDETLNDYAKIFGHYNHPESFAPLQMEHMAIVRDIMASQKIVEEYIKYYNKGSNVYIFVGDGHVKRLKYMIEQKLAKMDIDQEMHVGIAQIFPEWVKDHKVRDEAFEYYLEKTGQSDTHYD